MVSALLGLLPLQVFFCIFHQRDSALAGNERFYEANL